MLLIKLFFFVFSKKKFFQYTYLFGQIKKLKICTYHRICKFFAITQTFLMVSFTEYE